MLKQLFVSSLLSLTLLTLTTPRTTHASTAAHLFLTTAHATTRAALFQHLLSCAPQVQSATTSAEYRAAFAAILEALAAVAQHADIALETIEEKRQTKCHQRGAYTNHDLVMRVRLPHGHYYIPTYEANPGRYPETAHVNDAQSRYREFTCNKLWRDNGISLFTSTGADFDIKVLTDEEFIFSLKEKLHEEMLESLEATTQQELIEELGDVVEIMHALTRALQLPQEICQLTRLMQVR